MKTAVSIPDALFAEADELARKTGKSRSEIYREALSDYVARRRPDAITQALNEVADELTEDSDGFRREATRRTLSDVEW